MSTAHDQEQLLPRGRSRSELMADTLPGILDRHRLWLQTDGKEGARAELAGIDLRGTSFWHADLRDADLEGANLGDVNLDHARLRGASLEGACLVGASLWEADLSEANLAAADLRRAKLDHARLCAADMRGANLEAASFWGAHLEAADLRAAEGLTRAQLEPAFLDARTRLPGQPISGEKNSSEEPVAGNG